MRYRLSALLMVSICSAPAAAQVRPDSSVNRRPVQPPIGIVGVYGEVYLYVDLDNIARIVDRVVASLDRNPKILTQTLAAVDTTINAAIPRRP